MKRNLILYILSFIILSIVMPKKLRAQQDNFALLKGNAQEILATYLDRDSAMLFTYDRAGSVVIWDANNMLPIRNFNPVPSNIWRIEESYEYKFSTIEANNKYIWINTEVPGYYKTKRSEYAVYDRATSKKVLVSDTTFATNYIYIKNNGESIIAGSNEKTYFENYKPVYGNIIKKNNKGEIVKIINLPSFVTAFKVAENEKYVAVGYNYGGVDVFDLETFEKVLSSKPTELVDQVTTITFIENNTTIVYTYKFTGSEKIYIHKIGETSFNTETLGKGETQLKVKLSLNGKYLAVYNPFKFDLYDLEKKKFLQKSLPKSLFMRLNAMLFLTDDILLAAGGGMTNGINENYSVPAFDKAALFKVDINKQIHSSNFSYDDLNRSFLNKDLELLNDSTFKIDQHIVGANRLTNDFTPKNIGLASVANDAPTTVIWYVNASGDFEKNGNYKLYKSLENAPSDTIYVGNFNKIENYSPTKIHSDAELIFWESSEYTSIKKGRVTDFKGKIIHEFTFGMLYQNAAKFSKNGKWFSYTIDASTIKLIEIKNTQNLRTLNTGLLKGNFTQDRIVFDQQSSKMAYRFFDVAKNNQFILLAVNLNSTKIDTIANFGMVPYGYGLSADFKQIALSLSVNILDSTTFKNPIRLKEEAKYGFKNAYHPIVWLLDIKADTTLAVFDAKNSLRSRKLLVTSNSVIAMQDDGLFYHYKIKNAKNVITQWLVGKEQVLLAKDYYYATPGIANRVLVKQASSTYPIGDQDRFYNKPQNIMQDLSSNKQDLIKLYTEAFNKRIKQYDVTTPTNNFDNLASLSTNISLQQAFSTSDSLLKLDLNIGNGVAVKRLHVKVNNYAIYGKKGLEIKPNQKNLPIKIPLDVGENNISIQAIDEKNRYLKPLQLSYSSSFKPAKQTSKLFIISAGVSNYVDQNYNLKYAAKDAADFTKAFKYKNNFDTVIVKTLLNEKATSNNIIELIKGFKNIKSSDVIMLFLAGHGVLDDKANFYFATYDMDFKQPTKNGLSYDQIMSTLEDVPSKYKLLFMDACHSGLLDKSSISIKTEQHQTNNNIVLQDQRGTVVTNKSLVTHKETDVFFFMQKVFNNFSYDNNINILSASLGNSYALENDSLKNGLFTYSLIRAIGLSMAKMKSSTAASIDDLILVNDLTNFLSLDVKKLSNGKQVPTFAMSKSAERIMFIERNSDFKFDVDYKPLDPKDYKPSEETLHKLFLERYKDK